MVLNHAIRVRFPVAVPTPSLKSHDLYMRFDVITIFPEQIKDFIQHGIYRIATSSDKAQIHVHDLRDWTDDRHRTVDDRPYGGGAGMVLKVEPVYKALKDIRQDDGIVILPTPRGKKLDQPLVRDLFGMTEQSVNQMIFLCGHYEGFDERIHQHLVDMEISIGDYVLSGGELPALAILDSILRLIPGVLGNDESALDESFEDGQLEYPQYTRPEEFEGWKVPEVLLSGDHKKIREWKETRSAEETKLKRPDLIK